MINDVGPTDGERTFFRKPITASPRPCGVGNVGIVELCRASHFPLHCTGQGFFRVYRTEITVFRYVRNEESMR